MSSPNPEYAAAQLTRALQTELQHPDPATRQRAADKVARWQQVLQGLWDGTLAVGSRTPVAGTPAWATLEVVTGGFATGALLAGGPLRDHERARLRELGLAEGPQARAQLNAAALGEDGQAELWTRLREGSFRLEVPEEAAWMTVAWLLQRGDVERATALLAELSGYTDRLRFYPTPATPRVPSPLVHVAPVGEVQQLLAQKAVPRAIARQREAVLGWLPWLDALVGLLLETLDGPAPHLQIDATGALVRAPNGQPMAEGALPGAVWPAGWLGRAQALLAQRPEGAPTRRVQRLLPDMERFVAQAPQVSPDVRARLRHALAGLLSQRGDPSSPEHQALRARQRALAERPSNAAYAHLLAARLAALPRSDGLPSAEAYSGVVTAQEAHQRGLPEGAALPASVVARLWRCVEGSVEELVERGVVGSGEVLARLLPQLSAQVAGAAFADEDLRRLYIATYEAFRRRRGLLLLHLEHQVRVDELPWVAAMLAYRTPNPDSQSVARQTLGDVAALALVSFPQTQLPNPLVTELRALSQAAGLQLPWVEELAADIFMGTFTPKFVQAAHQSAALYGDRLYTRYYGIDWSLLPDPARVEKRWGVSSSPDFAALCEAMANPSATRSVVRNGMILEASQLLTTHNQSLLLGPLCLAERLHAHLPALARRCFGWIVGQLSRRYAHRRDLLRTTKNAAYAWRQMLGYLSLVDDAELLAFLDHADAALASAKDGLAPAFRPALVGLRHVATGGSFDGAGRATVDGAPAHRFLGWTNGDHWLLTDALARLPRR